MNDGSKDRSLERLHEQALFLPRLRIVDLRRNFGQTAALMAGIDHARGDVVVMINADLQNDPEDIPILMEKIRRATTWCRAGARTARTLRYGVILSSRVANSLISRISGVPCTITAAR